MSEWLIANAEWVFPVAMGALAALIAFLLDKEDK
jgi:hypothetical protein